MSDEAECAHGRHDYLPPVVVRHERRALNWMLLIFGDSDRGSWERAATFCRRCGQVISHGWQPAGMIERDEEKPR
jgi:hypothetical protein